MLEYFTYKKVKKHKAEKAAKDQAEQKVEVTPAEASQPPATSPAAAARPSRRSTDSDRSTANFVLRPDDESFLESILSNDDETPPPLPPRTPTPVLDAASDIDGASVKEDKGKGKGKEKDDAEKKPNRLSLFFTRNKKASDGLKPEDAVPPAEAEREKKDLGNVLDRLNLSAKNNKVVSLSNDSSELLRRFTQVFKDLVNGVPTAYGDLTKLFEDRDGAISRGFEKLPSSLQKLVTQLPDKLTSTLAPELLAVAAESQGLKASSSGNMKDAAKMFLTPTALSKLVTKPGALVGMLRAIVEALKARWPAFLGMNVIWTVALSLLLFMLWYCYKRGREVRLESEQSGAEIDGSDRIEELPDDPMLPPPKPERPDIDRSPTAENGGSSK